MPDAPKSASTPPVEPAIAPNELHNKLIQNMQGLGYAIDSGGICFGYACMGMQAMHQGQSGVNAFDKRNKLILDTPDLIQKIQAAEEKRMQIVQAVNAEHPIPKGTSNKQITEQRASYQHFIDDALATKLDDNEKTLLEIKSFFDGIKLSHATSEHQEMFAENEKVLLQDLEKSAPLIASQALTANPMVCMHQVCGLYHTNGLTAFLKSFADTMKAQSNPIPVTMLVEIQNHAISIGYDPKEDIWTLIEANRIYSEKTANLSPEIFKAFFLQPYSYTMSLSFNAYVTKNNMEAAEKFFSEWKQSKVYRDNQTVTHSNATRAPVNKATWLFMAANMGNKGLVKTLLENEADPNAKEKYQHFAPLHVAVQHGYGEVVELLIDKNADINIKNISGTTPLYVAAFHDRIEMAALLLNHGADINSKTEDGATPLFIASQCGNEKTVKLLLKNKANPEINFTSTVKLLKEFAENTKNPDIMKNMATMIATKSAIHDPTTKIDLSPRDIAWIMGHKRVTALLDAKPQIKQHMGLFQGKKAETSASVISENTEHKENKPVNK
jgi:hypothetical protein